MILLITGAITPAKGITKTTLIDNNKRKDQYIASIKRAVKQISRINEMTHSVDENAACQKYGIVYCDNSAPESIIFDEVKQYAKTHHVKFEVLSFKGDEAKISEKGKGFGEGEITKYALENSKLLSEDGYFIKLTGRLFIDNLSVIMKKVSCKKAYFNIPNHTERGMCDTRFYAVPVSMYKEYFLDAYQNVNDGSGHYYEHVFLDVIRKYHLKTYNFPVYPLYKGVSGSAGSSYTYVGWKSKVKDILSIFQYYKVK